MGKILLGTTLLVLGLFASFIPPFIWGIPLFVIGVTTMMAGFATTTVSAAKTVVAVSKEISRASTSQPVGASAPLASLYSGAPPSAKRYDEAKWRALVELDDDVGRAAELARNMGPGYEDLLAEKYLPLNDKMYLEAALRKVSQQAASDDVKREQSEIITQVQYEEEYDNNKDIVLETVEYSGKKFDRLATGECRTFSKIIKRWIKSSSESLMIEYLDRVR